MTESYVTPRTSLESDVPLEIQEEHQSLDPLQLCCSGVCAALEPSLHEVSDDEEELLESFDEVASTWLRVIETSRHVSSAFYQSVDKILAQKDTFPSGVRQSARIEGFIEPNLLAQYRHRAQQHVAEIGRQAGLDSGLSDLTVLRLGLDTFDDLGETLNNHMLEMHKTPCLTIPTPHFGQTIANMFEAPFLVEAMCRLGLASSIVEYPQFMKQVFDPNNITNLPLNVQRLAASDIARGVNGSLILSLFSQKKSNEDVKDVNAPEFGDRLYGHIACNGLSEVGKNIVAGIAYGVKAQGAPNCPANSAGLCTQALKGKTEEGVPPILIEELDRRESKSDSNAILALQKYATQPGLLVSKWWRSSERINYTIGDRPTATPRKGPSKGVGRKADALTMQSVRDGLLNSGGFDTEWASNEIAKAAVYVPGQTEHLTAEAADEQGRKELLDTVMASEEFADFLAKYSNDKTNLVPLLRAGVDSILFASNYRKEKAINCISYLPPYTGPDRKRHPIWRFSGRQSPLGTSKTGRQTRIYFWHEGEGDSREVHIIGVRHKTAVEKTLKRSGDL